MSDKEPEYDMSIHTNPDAVAWAKFFKETCNKLGKECDEEWMVTWFANTMMAMHDHLLNIKVHNGDHLQYLMDKENGNI